MIRAKWWSKFDGCVVDLEPVAEHVAAIRHCKEQIAALEAEMARYRRAVEDALGDNEIGILNGRIAVTWRHLKRRGLDTKALRRRHPEIYELFCTTTPYRRMDIAAGEAD